MEVNKDKTRMSHIDDIRSLVIFLVVMIHSSVTYSGLGGWYVTENKSDSLNVAELVAFGFFNSFNQAWFMGILFFFGGYFAAESLARKGLKSFVMDRLKRLGIPLFGFMFVINPLMVYFIAFAKELRGTGTFSGLYFGKYIASGMVWGETGPLWFAEALLIFCLIYALVAKLRLPAGKGGIAVNTLTGADSALYASSVRLADTVPAADTVSPAAKSCPSTAALLVIILATAVAAFAIRLVFPIGTDVLNLQFCYFTSYFVLFALGVRGASRGWFVTLTSGKKSRWLTAVACVGVPFWAAIMLFGGALEGDIASINGGLRWQSAAYALWESFTAIGMSVGLTAVFANRASLAKGPGKTEGKGTLSRFFSRNSFSVYVFHPVFLIGLTKLLGAWSAPPLVKALLVGLSAFALSLAFAELAVRRIPFVRKYF